jgi:hypothetical protein
MPAPSPRPSPSHEFQEILEPPDAANAPSPDATTATTTAVASGLASNAFGAPDRQGIALFSDGVYVYVSHDGRIQIFGGR